MRLLFTCLIALFIASSAPLHSQDWQWPVNDPLITQTYACDGCVPLTSSAGPCYVGTDGHHVGIDLKDASVDCAVATVPVSAADAGVVRRVETSCTNGDTSCGRGLGNHVFVEHQDSSHPEGPLYSVYGHLDTVSVVVGQNVQRGAPLGTMGQTGFVLGANPCHVHFTALAFTPASFDPAGALGFCPYSESHPDTDCNLASGTCPNPATFISGPGGLVFADRFESANVGGWSIAEVGSSLIFGDDFDDNTVDTEKWVEARGLYVTETNGEMRLTVEQTDKYAVLETRLIEIDPSKTVIINRRVKLGFGNDRYVGVMRIFPEADWRDTSFAIHYGNMTFMNNEYCPVQGFYMSRYYSWPHNCADQIPMLTSDRMDPIWGSWFTETLYWRPDTGDLSYLIDGYEQLTWNVGPIDPTPPVRISIEFVPWGWYTGHSQFMDDLEIRQ